MKYERFLIKEGRHPHWCKTSDFPSLLTCDIEEREYFKIIQSILSCQLILHVMDICPPCASQTAKKTRFSYLNLLLLLYLLLSGRGGRRSWGWDDFSRWSRTMTLRRKSSHSGWKSGRFVEVQAGDSSQWSFFQVGRLNSSSENCVKGKQNDLLMDIPSSHSVVRQM